MHKSLMEHIHTLPLEKELQLTPLNKRLLIHSPYLGGAYYFAIRTILDLFERTYTERDVFLINNGFHPDVRIFVPENNIISISLAKEIQHQAGLSPQGRENIIVIKDIDLCTIEASNALLKTIEEPPKKTRFLCTTEHKEDVIETLLSRLTATPCPTRDDMLQLYFKDEESFLTEENYTQCTHIISLLERKDLSFKEIADALLGYFTEDSKVKENLFLYLASNKLENALKVLYNDTTVNGYHNVRRKIAALHAFKESRIHHGNKKLAIGMLVSEYR